MGVVQREKILAQNSIIRAENALRRGIDAQHRALFIQKDKPLAHGGGDLLKFLRFAAEKRLLLRQGKALPIDAAQQRRNFFICIVFQRMLQIQMVQRLNNALCKP